MIGFTYNDGGRKAAGFKRRGEDCSVRAIAIALELPYAQVYADLHEAMKAWAATSRCYAALEARDLLAAGTLKDLSPSHAGVVHYVSTPYIEAHGWEWVPTITIGSRSRVRLRAADLPGGRLIVKLSNHLCAVIDGTVHDTIDPRQEDWVVRPGYTRCVYGYFQKAKD
jgi:hypothetical protein